MGNLRGTLIGRLCQDAEQRHTSNGTTVVSFTIAIDNYKTKKVKWVRVELWRDLGALLGSLIKGRQVILFGRLEPDEYTNQQTGVVTEQLKFIATDIELGAEPKEKPRHTGGEPFPSKTQAWGNEDIPF